MPELLTNRAWDVSIFPLDADGSNYLEKNSSTHDLHGFSEGLGQSQAVLPSPFQAYRDPVKD